MDQNGHSKLPDKLIVKGLGKRLDGEYECDLAGMMTLDDPSALTNREAHRIKVMAGVTAGQIETALMAGDNDVLVALGAVILTRSGKTFDEDVLWDAPAGSALDFDIAEREEEDDEESPPVSPSTSSVAGGESSSPETSESLESVPSPCSHPGLGNAYLGPGLAPSDLGELTPLQLWQASEFWSESSKESSD